MSCGGLFKTVTSQDPSLLDVRTVMFMVLRQLVEGAEKDVQPEMRLLFNHTLQPQLESNIKVALAAGMPNRLGGPADMGIAAALLAGVMHVGAQAITWFISPATKTVSGWFYDQTHVLTLTQQMNPRAAASVAMVTGAFAATVALLVEIRVGRFTQPNTMIQESVAGMVAHAHDAGETIEDDDLRAFEQTMLRIDEERAMVPIRRQSARLKDKK